MNTVQAQQFAALQKATASYNNDANMADHMRRREADVMSRAAEQNRRDEEELRIAHGELGEETRKQKDHEIEKKRYKHAVETDRQSIVKITSELKGIEVRRFHFSMNVEDSPLTQSRHYPIDSSPRRPPLDLQCSSL